jgi:hypothetical protein
MSAAVSISMEEALGSLIKLDGRFSPDMDVTRAAVPRRKSPRSVCGDRGRFTVGLSQYFPVVRSIRFWHFRLRADIRPMSAHDDNQASATVAK